MRGTACSLSETMSMMLAERGHDSDQGLLMVTGAWELWINNIDDDAHDLEISKSRL